MTADNIPAPIVAIVDSDGNAVPAPTCCRCRPCWSCALLHPNISRTDIERPAACGQEVTE